MFVATFTGCEQKILFEDEDKIVYIPEHGYIFFNSTASNSITRGTLVTDMKRDIGVLGYKWDFENTNDIWTTVEKAAKPVVIDIAVSLAKKYSDDKQSSFINAILNEVLN